MEALDRIIWSADVSNTGELFKALDLMPDLRIVKIDRLFVTDTGLQVIDTLGERGIKVFDDAKIIEIPSKLEGIAKKHLAHRPWMLNCMAGGISSGVLTNEDREKIDGLKRFADACHQYGVKPCGVTVLTSKTDAVVREEFGRDSVDQVLYYAYDLLSFGFTDMVCSTVEIEAIRKESALDALDLDVPGIRPLWTQKNDQARIGTPNTALQSGATRLVIGRPITDGDPAENLRMIVDEISVAA